MIKFLVFFMILFGCANSYTIQDAIKIQFSTLTPKKIIQYKKILNSLAKENNHQAIYMLAIAYKNGGYWERDINKSIALFKKISKYDYKDTNLQLGLLYKSKRQYNSAIKYLKYAKKKFKKKALILLLHIALEENNKKLIKKYFSLCKKNDIKLDKLIINNINNHKISTKTSAEQLENVTFEATKKYILTVIKTIKSSKAMIRNLGFKVSEYSIDYSFDPTVVIVVKQTDNKIDIEMAKYLARGNMLKQAILKALVFAIRLEPFLKNEAKQSIKLIEFEVGEDSHIRITTKDINK